jgi:opacity protein-like surface antigen
MRRFLKAALLGLALALVPASASAAVVQNVTMPLNQVVLNPCNGDTFTATGNIHLVMAETADGSGGLHIHVDVNVSNVTGVGSVTGATYHGIGGFWFEISGHPPFPFTTTSTNVFGLISQGSTANLVVTSTFHLTVNADGTVISSVDRFSFACH